MASFSRLQLAAALLEYDNDPDNPNAPKRSAYESAIFAHLRNSNGNIHAKKPDTGKNNDYLGVSLPSEAGGASDSQSGIYKDMTRRSKGSIDMLHNPFGKEEEVEEEEAEEEEEDMEVDLASWGLDSLIPDKKENKSAKGKGKAKSEILASNGRNASMGLSHSRSASMPLAGPERSGGSIQEVQLDYRRNSISNPLDLVDERPHNKAPIRQRTLSLDKLNARPPSQAIPSPGREDTVPFPTSPILSGNKEIFPGSRPASRFDDLNATQETESNPFAIPPPPPSRASRFDPKSVAHVRTLSNATRLSTAPQGGLMPREPSTSALDVGQLRERRQSTATMHTRDMLDDDFRSTYGYDERPLPARERRYSRLDLMRPKVLVMPSPLQGAIPAPIEHIKPTRDGFLDSSDGRPLPPGARASRTSVLGVPVPVNSFTPNPRLSLSSSQLLFRNNLMVDGQRDVAYNDIDGGIQRAVEDGEQVIMPEPKEDSPKPQPAPLPAPDTQDSQQMRPAGKLFGRSLIDDLEARKAEMRGKQRVFTGDQRPSMMDRPGISRSSTLIDPSAFGDRPTLGVRNEIPHTDTTLVRRGSRNSKPLLAIDDAGKIAETGIRESRIAQTRSVFGVDTLWAREVEKLKVIEAEEKAAEEERRIQEEKEEARRAKKSKGKNRGKKKDARDKPETSEKKIMQDQSPISPRNDTSFQKQDEVSITLPDIPVVTSRRRVVRAPVDNGSDYESSASASEVGVRTGGSRLADDLVDQWVSDDEKKLVPPSSSKDIRSTLIMAENDSDEDLPLSVTLERATRNLSLRNSAVEEDSDEDKPLSSLLVDRPKIDIPSIDFDNLGPKEEEDDEDEDDVPLGVRISRMPAGASQVSALSSLSVGDDDDRPLSMHPGQIRKSQFNLFAQMQQQQQIQQQQMLQAQLAQSMAFSAQQQSMMFMVPPPAVPNPYASQPSLPVQDNKFSSVDRWRHGVAVEGSSN